MEGYSFGLRGNPNSNINLQFLLKQKPVLSTNLLIPLIILKSLGSQHGMIFFFYFGFIGAGHGERLRKEQVIKWNSGLTNYLYNICP